MSRQGGDRGELTRRARAGDDLFERYPLALYRASLDDRFIALNRAALQLFAASDPETLSRIPIRQLYVDPSERDWWQARMQEAGVFRGFEVEVRKLDGRQIWVRDTAHLVVDDEGEPVFYEGALEDVTDERMVLRGLQDAQRRLTTLDAERRDLLVHLVHTREIERRRIAAEIHDDTIQEMTAVALDLERLAERGVSPELRDLNASIRGAITRLRTLAFDLHPTSLEREGLASTLRTIMAEIATRTGLTYELVDELGERPGTPISYVLYRIVHEALANVRKHARASKVSVSLVRTGPGISGEVRDDGVGLQQGSTSSPGHLGIVVMKQLAEGAGGWLEVDDAPGRGTLVRFWIRESVSSTEGGKP